MKQSLASISLILLGLSIVFLILWTVFESAFLGMSNVVERILTFALLVLPAGIGAVAGAMSLMNKEERTALAVTGIILNTLFALFYLALILFGG